MTEIGKEFRSYSCGFMLTARIVAWLWRRKGYQTYIGTFRAYRADGSFEVGYRVTGRR